MALPKYSLTFTIRGDKLRLTVYRLFKLFGYGLALTKLEKVSDGQGNGN